MNAAWRRSLVAGLSSALLLVGCGIRTGANGSDGADGSDALLQTSAEAAGENCAGGGTRVQYGQDLNGDGRLDLAEELEGTFFVCDGAEGVKGLDGRAGAAGPVGADGKSAQARTEAILPGDETCPNGGTRISVGIDDDGDGLLGAGEADTTTLVCNGRDGVDGANGADGSNGTDGTDGADGRNTLMLTSPLASGSEECASGGVRIQAGLDTNGNGSLDLEEVQASQVICHGSDGANGQSALIATSQLDAGSSQCEAGGVLVRSGTDVNGDGVLAASEVQATQIICNGVSGANGADGANGANGADGANGVTSLMTSETLLAGSPECTFGGTRVQSGLDLNRNAILEPEEVQATQTVCNGAPGYSSLMSVVPATTRSLLLQDMESGVTTTDTSALLSFPGNLTIEVMGAMNLSPFMPDGAGFMPIQLGYNLPGSGDFLLHPGEVLTPYYVLSTTDGREVKWTQIALADVGNWVTDTVLFYAFRDGLQTGFEERLGDVVWDPNLPAMVYSFADPAFENADRIVIAPRQTSGFGTPLALDNLVVEDGECANGGQKLLTGLDDGMPSGIARDGVLQPGEVDQTALICVR